MLVLTVKLKILLTCTAVRISDLIDYWHVGAGYCWGRNRQDLHDELYNIHRLFTHKIKYEEHAARTGR